MAEPAPPRRRADLLVEDVDDGLVAIDERRGTAHAMNATAAAVFELLDGVRGVDAIVSLVAEATGTERARVSEDVRRAVDELAARGLLEDRA